MHPRERLAERYDCFIFEYKPSEVNYGGKTRFQQAAFPPAAKDNDSFEVLVYHMVQRFDELLEERVPAERQSLVTPQIELSDIFFDYWSDFPQMSFLRFQTWFEHDVKAVADAYSRLRMNAMAQERSKQITRLNYFVALAAISCIAEIVSDYFEKNIDRLGRIATMARTTLGRCLALSLHQVEQSPELVRQRGEMLGKETPDEGVNRLLNPFILGFADAADAGLLDELLSGTNAYHISHGLRNRILGLVSQMIGQDQRWEVEHPSRVLAEPTSLARILQGRQERRWLVRAMRRQPELGAQIVLENACFHLRQCLRRYLTAVPDAAALVAITCSDKRLLEILFKSGSRRQMIKLLHDKRSQPAYTIRQVLKTEVERVTRSRRSFFGRLTRREWLDEIEDVFRRLSGFLIHAEDFRQLRNHYGRNSNHNLEWQNLKLWRSHEMRINEKGNGDKDRFVFTAIWDRRQAEVENSYDEGNLFLCRAEGEIYSASSASRRNVIFMFADLRNSTETTMKLTKDTASYLTPYLTAVNTAALSCGGERIYFAGDGYAAYYTRVADAIRAAYTLNAQFYKLRKVSNEEHIRRAKEIYQAANELQLDLQDPRKLRQSQPQWARRALKEEVREFIKALMLLNTESLSETVLRKVLSQVAMAYSMPRVDVGVALTRGELFLALVGEEQEEKIPIVISPQLTQAARLSGSSDLVRNYIETHLPQPLMFNVYTWDKKLFNRGIVMTEDLFTDLRQELEVHFFETQDPELRNVVLHTYLDPVLQKRILIRECEEPVLLKGIDNPCKVFEIAPPGSHLDRHYGQTA